MGVKNYRPMTPSLRFKTGNDFSEITKKKPEKSLVRILKKKGGRNNLGRVTAPHRGGGSKRFYRVIDFKRNKYNVEARVSSIEYDPNRSARIALLFYKDGEKRYIISPKGLKVGDTILSGEEAPIKPGNALPLKNIPLGQMIHNIELVPGKGGQLVRSAGTSAQLLAKEGKYAHIKLPSGEVRLVNQACYATIGEVGNEEHNAISLGKAGRKRWLGRRPHVRGMAMNPVDHPMGGGEGRSKGHMPQSRTGVPAKGYKTRKKRKPSSRFIVSRRK